MYNAKYVKDMQSKLFIFLRNNRVIKQVFQMVPAQVLSELETEVSSLYLLFLATLARRRAPWLENESESAVGARLPG